MCFVTKILSYKPSNLSCGGIDVNINNHPVIVTISKCMSHNAFRKLKCREEVYFSKSVSYCSLFQVLYLAVLRLCEPAITVMLTIPLVHQFKVIPQPDQPA